MSEDPLHDFELLEREDEDRSAPNYHRLYHGFPLTEYWDDDFAAFVSQHYAEGDRVLDLGCGPGSLWERWKKLPAPGRLVGVDLSPGMIEEARRRHPEGDFHVGRAHELPFDSGSFDLVIASSVLHHIPDEHVGDAIDEIARVLDEHGRLVGREPSSMHGLGRTPGHLSTAIMHFRHLVFRLTRSREYPEPGLGAHHHVPDLRFFLGEVSKHLPVVAFGHRFAFSNYVLRVRSDAVAAIARLIDSRLEGQPGAVFYYAGQKNFVTASEVEQVIELARLEAADPLSETEFLAYLQAATREIQQLFRERTP